VQEVLIRRRKQQAEKIEIAREFVRKLRAEIGTLTAWVYGSVARGTFKTWSDIDVFIAAENLPNNPMQRLELLYRHASGGIEPKAWTKSEFLRKLEKGDKQLSAMLKERTLLIDELGLEQSLQAKTQTKQ